MGMHAGESARRSRMTPQAAMTGLAALVCVAMSMVISFVPTPFVTWAPGSTMDLLAKRDGKPSIEISGTQTYPATGSLILLTVAQSRSDSRVTLPEALLSHWMPDQDVLPREFVYPDGLSKQQQDTSDVQLMADSQQEAVVAGLRAAGRTVTPMPVVAEITNSGPANGLLKPGDLVSSVDGVTTDTPEAVYAELQHKEIGSSAVFTVLRHRQPLTVSVPVVGGNQNKSYPVVGVTFHTGYRFAEEIKFNIDPGVVGSSGGLMFALAIYDRLQPRDLPGGRIIAGTGRIDALGNVSAIGGVDEKLAAAEAARASVFFLPESNCTDMARTTARVKVVKVSSLQDAINALDDLANPATAGRVPTC